MKKKNLVFILVMVLISTIVTYFIFNYSTASSISINQVEMVENYLDDSSEIIQLDNGIKYSIIDDENVLLIDERNVDYKNYIRSEVSATNDVQGNLNILISDKIANNESDISGKYAVIIKSNNKIRTVDIEILEED